MSEQVLNQFRSDKTLREDCVKIYEAMGMDINTAFRMFMERTRMVRGLPFPAVLPSDVMTPAEARTAVETLREQAKDMPEMTLEEINAEISAARADRQTCYPQKYIDELREEISKVKEQISRGKQPVFDSIDKLFDSLNE